MSTVFHPPKRKTFYHRSHIPDQLQRYLKGHQQLWRSLKTEDKDEAILRSAQWTARIRQLFLTLKKQGARSTRYRPVTRSKAFRTQKSSSLAPSQARAELP